MSARTWASDLMSRAEEAACQLDALGRVEWSLDDEDERVQLSFGLRGAKRSVMMLLTTEHLEKPACLSADELEDFDVAAWREEALVTCWELAAIVRALAHLAEDASGVDAAILTYGVEGVARMLDDLANRIDRAASATQEHAAE